MEKVTKELEQLKETINNENDVAEDRVVKDLLHNINPALENPGELSFEYHRDLMKSLENAVEAFEVRHPRIVDEIRIVINSLNDIGI